ncbi:Serine/threonine protein kinase [Forsythia ovata]|uniref:non-specific serine/threonine protein kinase n=1 Tax=Forsythia ovata TaxID=205694 RepID=A0ABD1PI17_9LAMI
MPERKGPNWGSRPADLPVGDLGVRNRWGRHLRQIDKAVDASSQNAPPVCCCPKISRLHNHPFLPCLIELFENHEIICWAIPFCPGGDLNVLRYRQNDRVFSSVRFLAAGGYPLLLS